MKKKIALGLLIVISILASHISASAYIVDNSFKEKSIGDCASRQIFDETSFLSLGMTPFNSSDPPITLSALIQRLESDFGIIRNCTQCDWITEMEKAILGEYIRYARASYTLAQVAASMPLIAYVATVPIGQLTWGSLATYIVIESILEHHDFASMATTSRDLLLVSLYTASEAAMYMERFPCYSFHNSDYGGGTPTPGLLTLTRNVTYNDLIISGAINLNGFTMTVNGDLIVNGTVSFNGGGIIVNGDCTFNSRLSMQNENDYLFVTGDFTVSGGSNPHIDHLTAGTVELKGNFSQLSTNAIYVYYATGTHRTIFSGTGTQEISFENTSSHANGFNMLETTNNSTEGIVFKTFVTIASRFIHNENNFTLTNGGSFPTYSITFNPNSGSVNPTSAMTEINGKLSNLPTPERSGFTFKGWFTALTGGTQVNTDTTFIINSTIYAQWVEIITNSVTIPSAGTGATGGGDFTADVIVNINAGTPPSGQQFSHWTATGITPPKNATTSFVMPANAVTVTANFEDIPTVDKLLISITPPTAITGLANGTEKTAVALGLPSTVVMETDNGNVNANVTWNVATSSYNPALTTAQTFTINGTVTLPSGVVNTNSVSLNVIISVTVNEARELISITAPTAITGRPNGSPKTVVGLNLPSTVIIITDNGNVQANVIWNVAASTYNPATTTAQTFTVNGSVTLPSGVINSNDISLAVSISVTVNAQTTSSGGGSTGGSSGGGGGGGGGVVRPLLQLRLLQPLRQQPPQLPQAQAHGRFQTFLAQL